jgi:hypothetical protein
MIIKSWRFKIHPNSRERVEREFGPEGIWAQHFRRPIGDKPSGFVRTELTLSVSNPLVYETRDYWESEESFKAHMRAFDQKYALLDEQCAILFQDEQYFGTFAVIE